MPRRGRDGEAAQAGAADSVAEEVVNVTDWVNLYPQTKGDRKANRVDLSYFEKHPGRESYVRKYIPGELPTPMLLAQPEGVPSHVAVAYVFPGERVRVFLWPGHNHAWGRRNAEAGAEAHRVKLGLTGKA